MVFQNNNNQNNRKVPCSKVEYIKLQKECLKWVERTVDTVKLSAIASCLEGRNRVTGASIKAEKCLSELASAIKSDIADMENK